MVKGKLLSLVVLGTLLIGLAVGPAAHSQQGQSLTIAFDAADWTTGDPHFAAATQDRAIADMVFNGLVRYKPGDITEFQPDLATDWEQSEDGTVWTFTLRQGVMCHPWNGNDGYELTSEDVVYSLEKAANSERSAYAGEYTDMTFEATGDYTVQITLAEPLSEALMLPKVSDYSGGFIVCKQAAEDLGDQAFQTNPVGTGPFMFSNYNPQQDVALAPNPDYFRGEPQLDEVTVRFMPNVSAREAGLDTGELDVIEGPPEQPWVEKMEPKDNAVVEVFGPGETATLHFNMSREPFNDMDVRKGLAYCIDRQEVLTTIGSAVADPIYSPVPPVLAGGMTQDEAADADLLYEVDRERARELLADATPLSFEVVISERASYLRPMQNIQSQLTQCGVRMSLRVVDHSSMHTLIREDINPIVLYIAWRPNADVFLTRFYHSDSIVVTGENPDTNFSHLGGVDANGDGEVESLDAIIEEARTELDSARQTELWKQAQTQILEMAVAHPFYIKKFVFARANDVDFGYELDSTLALYPQINELTTVQ